MNLTENKVVSLAYLRHTPRLFIRERRYNFEIYG